MAVLKAAIPLASHASMSGSVRASPRRACGSTLAWAVQDSRACSLGNCLPTSPGTATTSHSSPLDLWAVSTLTVSSAPGRELSRPFSYCSAVRRKPRKASSVVSPPRAAKPAAMSRKLDRVSRRRAASACGEAESSTSRPVAASTRCRTSMSGSASERRRSRSSAASRAKRTRASAENGSPSSGADASAARKVSRASARETVSDGSTPSTASASLRSGSLSPLP